MISRIKNLWIISGWNVESIEAVLNLYVKEKNNVGVKIAPLAKKVYRPATIIDNQPEVDLDEPLNEN